MFYLGSITGASGGYSNQAGSGGSGSPQFLIPKWVRSLYLVPSISGLLFEVGLYTGASGSPFQTTRARGAQIAGPGLLNGAYRLPRTDMWPVVSIFSDQAGTWSCRVYASPTD